MDDREVVAKIAAGDPAGIAEAYDSYAAGLYGYCHWMLRSPEDAAGALRDTFVIAAATLGDLSEAPRLRPWLYALARNECRIRPRASARAKETDAANQRTGPEQQAAPRPQPIDLAHQAVDATLPFRAILRSVRAADLPSDGTLTFPAIRQPIGAADLPIDATMPFRAILQPIGAADLPIDATLTFPAIRQPIGAADLLSDGTLTFAAIRQPIVVKSEPDQTDLPSRVRAILDGLKPREREIIELHFRHGLDDTDLATVLGVSWSRAHSLSARAHSRLKRALEALLIARTGRAACPDLDALLADWDGQLTGRARDVIEGHVEQCETCSDHRMGELRSAALSGLMPLAPLPPGLREQVLRLCSSDAPDALAYRRQVTSRAESAWLSQASGLIRLRERWSGRRPATATVVLATWVALTLATSITLLVLTSSQPSRALAAQPSQGRPVAAATAASAPASFSSVSPSPSPSPSPAVSQTEAVVPPPIASSAAVTRPSPSASRSAKPSKSPSPKPSKSASPSPSSSRSASPSPSPSASASPSKS